MRRLPPNKIEQNLTGLTNLIPQETDELLQRIDQPLTEDIDVATGKKFLLCDYNRDGDSYRSPWSNAYQPAIDDGFLPSEKLRAMEMEANDLFDAYRYVYLPETTSTNNKNLTISNLLFTLPPLRAGNCILKQDLSLLYIYGIWIMDLLDVF